MVGQYTTPTICVGPVRSHCHVINTSFSCAVAPPLKHSPTANITAIDALLILSSCASIRKWPHPKVISNVPPQAVQTFRLDHQEEKDEPPQTDQPPVGGGIGQIRLGEK